MISEYGMHQRTKAFMCGMIMGGFLVILLAAYLMEDLRNDGSPD